MKINAELTDTFGGEANYGWVRRAEFDMPDGASNLAIVRRMKRELSIESRTYTINHGDSLTLEFPRSVCLIAFAYVGGDA